MGNYSFSTIHAGGPFADGYDAEDRFMRFKRSGVTEDILLTRSNIGNISNVNRNGTNTARGYNTAHGLTTVSGGTTQAYDTDGNTTTLHTNVSAVWDDAGRMKNTNVPAGATAGIVGLNENGYVGGNRIWKKITRSGSVVEHRVHIHAGPNLIAEYNSGVAASTPVQEYVYAGEIDSLVLIRRSDATRYGVTRNRQWSITALHDLANGSVVERYAYEMTGKRTIYAANGTTVRTTSTYGNPFGYTNRSHDDESGLMYFRARYYNPLTGEFLSRDSIGFVDGSSLNRGYFGFSFVDPNGTELGCPHPHCVRDFMRIGVDITKDYPLLMKFLNLIGLSKLSIKLHIERKNCCECCNNVLDRTDYSETLGGMVEAGFTSKQPLGIYVRVAFSCSGTRRWSRCSGNSGSTCCTLSGEIGGIIQVQGGIASVGARAGIYVRGKCCRKNGGDLKCTLCYQLRARYFGSIGWWEWAQEYQTEEICPFGDDPDVQGGIDG